MNGAPIDKWQARRTFSRAANDYDAHAVLQHEIAGRLLERLDYVKLAPQRILDIGCGTGRASEALLRRYPKAQVVALDFALPMLAHARRRGRWLRRPRCVCGDMDRLPLAAQSFDLVFSSAALQWSADPAGALCEMHRVLRPGGLLMFTSFGPDTLRELRAAWAEVDGAVHVHDFIDLHDYGDMLVTAGMADPVMDCERITLTYADARGLLRDLRAIGAGNAAASRNRGLTGPARLRAFEVAYERFRRADDGRLPATWEVIYGHAWGAEQRREGDAVLVSPEVLRGR